MSMNGDGPTPRYDLSSLQIAVPEHVRDRAEERLGYRPSHEDIRQEVFDSIFRGRWSREQPPWLDGGDRRPQGGAVYAWPETERYAYVVTFGTPRPEAIRVRTLLAAEPRNSALREQLRRWLRANRREE